MRSLLDQILDRMVDGPPITLYASDNPDISCRFPLYKPSTGYQQGCRCQRCRAHKRAMTNNYQHRHTQRAGWNR